MSCTASTETLYQAAEQAHNTQFQFWALVFRSAVWACRGDFAKALALAEDATRIPRSGRDSQAEMSNKGILAVCLLKQGDLVRAKQLADETPVSYTHLDVYKRQATNTPEARRERRR